MKRFWSRKGPDSCYSKPEILKTCEKSDHAEQIKKSQNYIFLYMTPQGLRKVSVGQKPHKHDFPKLEICQKRLFWKNRNLPGKPSWRSHLRGGLGGRTPPQGISRATPPQFSGVGGLAKPFKLSPPGYPNH